MADDKSVGRTTLVFVGLHGETMLGLMTTKTALLALPALVIAPLLTGCASPAAPRTSIAPSWSYHDESVEPVAYSEVWGRPAEMGEVRVVAVDEPLR